MNCSCELVPFGWTLLTRLSPDFLTATGVNPPDLPRHTVLHFVRATHDRNPAQPRVTVLRKAYNREVESSSLSIATTKTMFRTQK